jgi:hypothetical protein
MRMKGGSEVPDICTGDLERVLVSSIFDHFDGACYPDQESIAGLAMEDVRMSHKWVTLFGQDQETGQEFRAVIRVTVNFPGSDSAAGGGEA